MKYFLGAAVDVKRLQVFYPPSPRTGDFFHGCGVENTAAPDNPEYTVMTEQSGRAEQPLPQSPQRSRNGRGYCAFCVYFIITGQAPDTQYHAIVGPAPDQGIEMVLFAFIQPCSQFARTECAGCQAGDHRAGDE
jgi:hypothetical protein